MCKLKGLPRGSWQQAEVMILPDLTAGLWFSTLHRSRILATTTPAIELVPTRTTWDLCTGSRMDPLSVTACIIGLVTTGAHLSKKLNEIIQGFRSAPEQLKALNDNLTGLCSILQRLEKLVNGNDDSLAPLPPDSVADLKGVLDSCMKVFIQLEAIFQKYSTSGSGLSRGFSSMWKQWRWSMDEKEIVRIKSEMEVHKATLNVALTLTMG